MLYSVCFVELELGIKAVQMKLFPGQWDSYISHCCGDPGLFKQREPPVDVLCTYLALSLVTIWHKELKDALLAVWDKPQPPCAKPNPLI